MNFFPLPLSYICDPVAVDFCSLLTGLEPHVVFCFWSSSTSNVWRVVCSEILYWFEVLLSDWVTVSLLLAILIWLFSFYQSPTIIPNDFILIFDMNISWSCGFVPTWFYTLRCCHMVGWLDKCMNVIVYGREQRSNPHRKWPFYSTNILKTYKKWIMTVQTNATG